MRRDREQRGAHPERPPSAAAALERLEQREGAEQRAEEEEAVHPPVDAVEEEQPAGGDEHGCGQRDAPPREPHAEQGHERQARECEHGGGDPQAAEPEAEVRDRPRDEEVERRAAPVAGDVLDDAGERIAADEERKRLVLVRRPRHQLVEEERPGGDRHAADPEPQPPRRDPDVRRGPRGRGRRRLHPCLDPLCHGVFAILAGRLAARCRSTSTAVRTGTPSRFSSG